jgi:uncharacterized membrane protein YgcG
MSRVYRSGEKGGLHRADLTQTATSQEFDAQRELCAHVMWCFRRLLARRVLPFVVALLVALAPLQRTSNLGKSLIGNLPAHASTPTAVVRQVGTTSGVGGAAAAKEEALTTSPAVRSSGDAALGTLTLQREGRVMDLSGVVEPSRRASILRTIDEVERDTGSEVQVVVVDKVSAEAASPKHLATHLFNRWGLGPGPFKNNGVLLLVSLGDRRAEIEVGEGLNAFMGTAWCEGTLEAVAVPAFKRGAYGEGVERTLLKVAQRLRDVHGGVALTSAQRSAVNLGGVLAVPTLLYGAFVAFRQFCLKAFDYDIGESEEDRKRLCHACNSGVSLVGSAAAGYSNINDNDNDNNHNDQSTSTSTSTSKGMVREGDAEPLETSETLPGQWGGLSWLGPWKTKIPATTLNAGLSERPYHCSRCGHEGKHVRSYYRKRNVSISPSPSTRRRRGSFGGGGGGDGGGGSTGRGGSSSGGGGGASW